MDSRIMLLFFQEIESFMVITYSCYHIYSAYLLGGKTSPKQSLPIWWHFQKKLNFLRNWFQTGSSLWSVVSIIYYIWLDCSQSASIFSYFRSLNAWSSLRKQPSYAKRHSGRKRRRAAVFAGYAWRRSGKNRTPAQNWLGRGWGPRKKKPTPACFAVASLTFSLTCINSLCHSRLSPSFSGERRLWHRLVHK